MEQKHLIRNWNCQKCFIFTIYWRPEAKLVDTISVRLIQFFCCSWLVAPRHHIHDTLNHQQHQIKYCWLKRNIVIYIWRRWWGRPVGGWLRRDEWRTNTANYHFSTVSTPYTHAICPRKKSNPTNPSKAKFIKNIQNFDLIMAQIDHEPSRTLHRRKTEKKNIQEKNWRGKKSGDASIFSCFFCWFEPHAKHTHKSKLHRKYDKLTEFLIFLFLFSIDAHNKNYPKKKYAYEIDEHTTYWNNIWFVEPKIEMKNFNINFALILYHSWSALPLGQTNQVNIL